MLETGVTVVLTTTDSETSISQNIGTYVAVILGRYLVHKRVVIASDDTGAVGKTITWVKELERIGIPWNWIITKETSEKFIHHSCPLFV